MPVQLLVFTKAMPTMMTNNTTPTLTITRTALVVALSRMPMTRITVTTSVMSMAGRFKYEVGSLKGSEHKYDGISGMCKTTRSLLRYCDQPAATTAQAIAYSRMRSQPMIQAN